MNMLTLGHLLVVGLIVLCTTLMGIEHALTGSEVKDIIIACLGSLSGHAVGYAAGKSAGEENAAFPRKGAPD